MRFIDEIIIHCSATRPEWMEGHCVHEQAKEIKRWHVEGNGWSDIGYHFVIGRNGDIAKGRDVSRIGAHCKGHNSDTIGVCLIGGFGTDADSHFYDHYTGEQMIALEGLIEDLCEAHGDLDINGHNQYANKACPGFLTARYFE